MNKLSFRARALDASKSLPIYNEYELPDSPDCTQNNRGVLQMPTGMEKEEESEHHLQKAICSGAVIPTPEVFDIHEEKPYDSLYPEVYKLQRQLIYLQPFKMESDIPDYDMDSEDESWVQSQERVGLTVSKFEDMMDSLEKNSGQQVVTLSEAKSLIEADEEHIIAVYDYWLNKRLKTQHPLISYVKTEARAGMQNQNPYIAFRRRTEKMQTRKNRKNDESSYEKMLKIQRELTGVVALLIKVKEREDKKRALIRLDYDVLKKRYEAGDFSGQLYAEAYAQALQQQPPRPALTPILPNGFSWTKEEIINSSYNCNRKEKRQYKKRKHKNHLKSILSHRPLQLPFPDSYKPFTLESEEESPLSSVQEEEDEIDGVYPFKRKKNCMYHSPIDIHRDHGILDVNEKNLYSSPSFGHFVPKAPPSRFLSHCRRGRGGRLITDRNKYRSDDEFWRNMGFKIYSSTEPENVNYPKEKESINGVVSSVPNRFMNPSLVPAPSNSFAHTNSSSVKSNLSSHAAPLSEPFELSLDPHSWLQERNMDSYGSALLAGELMPSYKKNLQSLDIPSNSYLGAVITEGDTPMLFPVSSLEEDEVLHPTAPSAVVETMCPVILDEPNADFLNAYSLVDWSYDPSPDRPHMEQVPAAKSSLPVLGNASSGTSEGSGGLVSVQCSQNDCHTGTINSMISTSKPTSTKSFSEVSSEKLTLAANHLTKEYNRNSMHSNMNRKDWSCNDVTLKNASTCSTSDRKINSSNLNWCIVPNTYKSSQYECFSQNSSSILSVTPSSPQSTVRSTQTTPNSSHASNNGGANALVNSITSNNSKSNPNSPNNSSQSTSSSTSSSSIRENNVSLIMDSTDVDRRKLDDKENDRISLSMIGVAEKEGRVEICV